MVHFAPERVVQFRPELVVHFGRNFQVRSDFLKYVLLNPEFLTSAIGMKTGVAIRRIVLRNLKKIEINVPTSLTEQKRIVAILDQAFEAIGQAEVNIERNIKNAEELDQAFTTQLIGRKTTGCENVPLEEVVKLARGHNPPKKVFIPSAKNGYVRFYQIRDGWSDKYAVYVPDSPKLHKVSEEDILMVAYRHIGRAFRGVNGAFNVALCKISNDSPSRLDSDYLFELIPSPLIRGELMKRSERSLIPSMSVKHLASIQIPLPTLDVQREIVSELSVFRRQLEAKNEAMNVQLFLIHELRKSILQKAFSGELTEKEVVV